MIIGVDGNEANVIERVGVSVYTLRLLEYFAKVANKNVSFVVFLKRAPNADLPKENPYFAYQVVAGSFLWSQTFLPFELYKRNMLGKKMNVFFSPAHYSPRFSPVPVVVTIHDLSYFYFPDEFLKKDLYQLTNWTKYSIEKAKKIISVSSTTKKDIIKFYHVPGDKIDVIYNGYERKNSKVKTQKSKKIGNWKLEIGKYLLYVGTLQPRKNILTLLSVFQKFNRIHPEYKLVVAGKKGWLYKNIFEETQKLGLDKKIKFVGYVTDEDLSKLYQNAFCFILPSFYEGFGIPILEAMSFGCPVISSFASSLPEVGGDACLYFDPQSADDLLDKLMELKENEKMRAELIQKGKKRIRQFSWKTCAEKTLEVITSSSIQ